MKYKIIKMTGDKIEFTEDQLTKLLDEVYEQGYADGNRNKYYYWSTPSTTPLTSPYSPNIVYCNGDSAGGKVSSSSCTSSNEYELRLDKKVFE